MSDHAAHEDHTSHYVRVWGILVVLLIISIIGPLFGHRVITLITAFGIAVVKAIMVARNFMHINVEQRFVPYAVLTCLVFMFLFFAGTAPDVMKPEGTLWQKPAWLTENADLPPYAEEHGEGAEGAAHH